MTSGSEHPTDPSPIGQTPDNADPQPQAIPWQRPAQPYGQQYPQQPPYPPAPNPGQPYGQQYPQQPPYPPAPDPGQPYGQAPHPYAQQPYPYQQQPYPQQPYPQQPYAPPVPVQAQRKNPFLGRLALLLVSISAIAASLSAIPIGQVMAQVMRTTGSTQIDQAVMQAALQASAAGPMSVFGLVTTVGTAAAVAGLVAAITGRGRAAGIVAVVVGCLAPVAWMIVLGTTIYPVVADLVR
jgi:hypothetical protein